MTEAVEGKTPNGASVMAHTADGDVLDVTEAVKKAYDIVVSSMDWGSGFLDHEEQHLMYTLAEMLGFELPDMPCFKKKASFAEGEGCTTSACNSKRPHWHMIDTGVCQVTRGSDE